MMFRCLFHIIPERVLLDCLLKVLPAVVDPEVLVPAELAHILHYHHLPVHLGMQELQAQILQVLDPVLMYLELIQVLLVSLLVLVLVSLLVMALG